jgi:hypothetical protein
MSEEAEGEIKGCVCHEVKSLARLGVSLDTRVRVYPWNRATASTAYSFFVAALRRCPKTPRN